MAYGPLWFLSRQKNKLRYIIYLVYNQHHPIILYNYEIARDWKYLNTSIWNTYLKYIV